MQPIVFTALAFALRFAPILATLPIFGGTRGSPTVRVALMLVLGVAAWPTHLAVVPASLLDQAAICVSQLFVGLATATVALWLMEVPRMVGGLGDIALGRGSFGGSDPLGASAGPLSTFYGLLFVAIFTAVGAHRVLLVTLASGLDTFPLDATLTMASTTAFADAAIEASAAAIGAALAFALPALCVGWVVDVSLGWAARTLPSLPVLFLSMPIRMLLGWLVLAASLSATIDWAITNSARALDDVGAVTP